MTKKYILFISLILSVQITFAQLNNSSEIDISAAVNYFKIADILQTNKEPGSDSWQEFFKTPVYQMMIPAGAIDTIELKAEMRLVYMPSSKEQLKNNETPSIIYHKKYKDNENKLKGHLEFLKTHVIIDSIKNLLYPFLPKRLQTSEYFPKLFYMNYGSNDATGANGIVINDLLQAYRADNFKCGIIAAHEAFHAIVSVSFQNKIKPGIDYNSPDFNLLYFLENISEEGIADLIDKPLLSEKQSPFYDELKELVAHDNELSKQYITRLDSLLTAANISDSALNHYSNFSLMANAFGKNGGHIPGRYMGLVIQKNGLLPLHLQNVEDPISFILTYNDAAKKSLKKDPEFSKESVFFLEKLRSKYLER